MTKILLGCDPEMFLCNIQGELKSSIGLVGGSKVDPLPLPLGPGFAVQEDNVAVEFNIPPASDAKEFINSINQTIRFLGDVVRDNYGLRISPLSAASFPHDQLMDPAALEFGCDPDYNAYTGRRNPRPKADDAALRSCGGHIHVGYDKKAIDHKRIIRMMDLHLGVPSILMDEGDLRKKLYGKAGAYREKNYGVEYRTLSNFWIFQDRLIEWAWNNTERAVVAADAQFALSEDDEACIVSCINSNDKTSAKQLVERFELEVV